MKKLISSVVGSVALLVGVNCFGGEVIPFTNSVPVTVSSLELNESKFESLTGNWVIYASADFSEFGGQVAGAKINKLIGVEITVTPIDLANEVGVPVEDLDNITNKQLQDGVRSSALKKAYVLFTSDNGAL
jgi:hypothetical protein